MAHNLLLDMRSLSINAVVYEHIGFYMNGCPVLVQCVSLTCMWEITACTWGQGHLSHVTVLTKSPKV